MDKKILWNISYGVYIVGTMDNERPTGCVANSIMQVTATPETVALSMNHDNFTNECIKKTGKFSVSILREDCDPGVIGVFGFQSGKTVDKFDGIPFEKREGVPVLSESCGYMVFEVINTVETYTHTVYIGQLIDADMLAGGTEMTYAYYHKVIKGKSPKNAPTYQAEELVEEVSTHKKEAIYRCSICNYIYEGEIPFEDLPEDYKCPICRQAKSVFVKE